MTAVPISIFLWILLIAILEGVAVYKLLGIVSEKDAIIKQINKLTSPPKKPEPKKPEPPKSWWKIDRERG